MTYKEITSVVANELGLSEKYIDRVYKTYWKVIREHISSLPLKEDLTDEEFLELRPNINIPSIGKLYITLDKYKLKKKKYKEHIKYKENAAHKEN